jgi:hypothetical protein
MPAKAGIQVGRLKTFWIPASAGMTVFSAENSPAPQIFRLSIPYEELWICVKLIFYQALQQCR